jgi:hypothetical protein
MTSHAEWFKLKLEKYYKQLKIALRQGHAKFSLQVTLAHGQFQCGMHSLIIYINILNILCESRMLDFVNG